MDVLMPQLGETVDEGKITNWFKKVGDAVKPGRQPVRDRDRQGVDGDAGNQRRHARGNPRRRGQRSAGWRRGSRDFGRSGGRNNGKIGKRATDQRRQKLPRRLPRLLPLRRRPPQDRRHRVRRIRSSSIPISKCARQSATTVRRRSGGNAITPLARRLAAEAGIDLSRVKGSGPHGRDRRKGRRAPRLPRAELPHLSLAVPPLEQVKAIYRDAPYEEVPLDGMRRTIATRLVQAKQTIPHFYLTDRCGHRPTAEAARRRERLSAARQGRQARVQAFAQ